MIVSHQPAVSRVKSCSRCRLAFFLLWIACVLPSQSSAGTLPEPFTEWLSYQTNVHRWNAKVIQTRQLKTLAQPLRSEGRIWFEAPNRFRWEIGDPPQTIAVRTSSAVEIAYPKLKRGERFALGAAGPWRDAMALLEGGFLRDLSGFEKQFNFVSFSTTNQVGTVHLQPKSGSARKLMPSFSLSFSLQDHALRGTELEFADGSILRNDFVSPVLNGDFAPALLESPLLPGYQVTEPLKH